MPVAAGALRGAELVVGAVEAAIRRRCLATRVKRDLHGKNVVSVATWIGEVHDVPVVVVADATASSLPFSVAQTIVASPPGVNATDGATFLTASSSTGIGFCQAPPAGR